MENGEPLFILNPFDYTVHPAAVEDAAETACDKTEDIMSDFAT